MAWHLYAVADWGEAPPPAEAAALTGIGGSPVHVLNCHGLYVAAGPHSASVEQLSAADLAAHAGVACRLLQTGATVLPFRFGVAAPDALDAVTLIQANASALQRELERLKGKEEAALAVFWEREGLQRELLRNPEARRWAALARQGGAEAAHLADVQLGQLVEQRLERWRRRYGQAIVEALKSHSVAVRTCRPIGIRMLLNFALLIRRDAEHALRGAVERVQHELRGRVRLRLTAPLPPFSFAEIVLKAPGRD